jgi:VanZ family protein
MKCRGDDPSVLTLPLVVGYCGLLLMLSTFVKPQFDTNLPVDKIGHFIVFAGLGMSVGRYFSKEFTSSATLGLALTLLSCAFFGLCDEGYQLFMSGRNAEGQDLLIDCLGAAAGGLLYLILLRQVCGISEEKAVPLKGSWPSRDQI